MSFDILPALQGGCTGFAKMEKKLKWVEVFETLQRRLREGVYSSGTPLPSEEAIVRHFKVSRITAVKAMDELRRRGLVYRKRGSGTFATRLARRESGRLGLIFPSLAFGEIFPVICQSLAQAAQRDGFSFVFGDVYASSPAKRAKKACEVARMFVEQHVAGVVFQPLAFLKAPDRITKEILRMLDEANIPVVLIDRYVSGGGTTHDFVGIDNLRAGRDIGAHLVSAGAKRIAFLRRPNCASVIRDRIDGVMSALLGTNARGFVVTAEPGDVKAVAQHFSSTRSRPDAVVCESDYVAAQFNATLGRLGLSVPGDVMLAGFDDVRIAATMTPPLTTVRQPCEDLARVAYQALRDRLNDATIPARHILLPAPLVMRESTRGRGNG